MAQLRAIAFLLLLVVLVVQDYSDARRFGGFGRVSSGRSSSSSVGRVSSGSAYKINYVPKPRSQSSSSSVTNHQRPLGFANSNNNNGINSGTQRPIGFVNPQNPGSSIGSGTFNNPYKPSAPLEVHQPVQKIPVQQSGNNGFNAGTQRSIGFVNPQNPSSPIGSSTFNNPHKPSAPLEVHQPVQKVPLQQSGNNGFNAGTQRPIGFVNPQNPSSPIGSGTFNPYKPSAPSEVHQPIQKVPVQQTSNNGFNSGTQRPIGFVNPQNPSSPIGSGTYNPYKPSALREVHETINKDQKYVNNMHWSGYNNPGGQVPYQGYGTHFQPNYGNRYNDYSSWYQQPHLPGGTTHINYGPVNYGHGYPSYGTSYQYTSSDYGSGALGFFLGYGLGKLTSPSYYYSQYHPDNVYHYDHYTVHHYYHNKDTVPQQLTVPSTAVVACAGNSTLLCPSNTKALCMSNGTIMCVAEANTLIRCPDNGGAYCVQSAIPQFNSTAPTTNQNSSTNTSIVNIPCISNATLYGNLMYQNNSIVLKDDRNLTLSNNGTSFRLDNSSQQNGNTTVTPLPANANPVVFCITIIAEPALKKPDAAILYDKMKGNALRFITKALGAD